MAARGYFFCRYCGSFHFPETAGDDGVRVLGVSAGPLRCPACSQPLASALLDEAHPVNYCRNCRGVLLPRETFAEVVRARRAWATGTPAPPVPLAPHELDRKITCPTCSARMTTHPYYGPGNVVMDSCDSCNVVWLDFGELRQIVEAPGRDRGTREHVARPTDDFPPDPRLASRGSRDAADDDLLNLLFRLF